MTMTSEPTPEGDLEYLEQYQQAIREVQGYRVVPEQFHKRVVIAAACRLFNLMGERLSRITMPITEHYDWQRLKINVAHKVEPKLVKWSKP